MNGNSFNSFNPSFPICMLSISFSCLVAEAKTSSTMLNTSGDSRHPYLVPNLLRREVFSLSPLSLMSAVGFS